MKFFVLAGGTARTKGIFVFNRYLPIENKLTLALRGLCVLCERPNALCELFPQRSLRLCGE